MVPESTNLDSPLYAIKEINRNVGSHTSKMKMNYNVSKIKINRNVGEMHA